MRKKRPYQQIVVTDLQYRCIEYLYLKQELNIQQIAAEVNVPVYKTQAIITQQIRERMKQN
jgi:hypothetical protein